MFEKQKNEEKCIEPCVGAVIFNNNGNILISKNKHWNNKYTIFGGHINFGEKFEDAVKREVKEETGLDINVEDQLDINESIFSNEYYKKGRHGIFFQFICHYDGGDDKIELNEEYENNYKWVSPEKALEFDLQEFSRTGIEKFIEYLKNKDSLEGWKRCQADFENYRK